MWGRRTATGGKAQLIQQTHHGLYTAAFMTGEAEEELRRLREDLTLAVKRADEAFREDPTRSSLNTATFRKARMADAKVGALKGRIAEIERTLARRETASLGGELSAFKNGANEPRRP
jgi:hypothetical protein